MQFTNDKNVFLSKLDKSKKGGIDRNIRKLVNLINKNPNFYTTSSCAGRIVLLKLGKANRKYGAEWLFVSHERITFSSLKKALSKARLPKEPVWFIQEGAILHVRCRDIGSAARLLNAARDAGFKHAGICSLGKKIMVEIIDTERIEMPVTKSGKLVVSDDYIRFLAKESNSKLSRTLKKIKRLEKTIKNIKN